MNPEVIMACPGPNDTTAYKSVTLVGEYYRVHPLRWHEIQYVTALEKNVDVWAPMKGNGVILSKQATPMIQ